MTLLEIFLVAIGLSMDAFAVAICKGLAMPQINKKQTLLIGAYFGVFQALMPLAGWLLGSQFAGYVTKLAPWIAFVLLVSGRACPKTRRTGSRSRGSCGTGSFSCWPSPPASTRWRWASASPW